MKVAKLLTLFIACSCSFFIEELSEVKQKIKAPDSKICHLQSDFVFIGENAKLIKVFQENYSQWDFSKEELIYAWTLANSLVRPDMINKNSFGGAFAIDNKNDKIDFLNFQNFKKSRINKIIGIIKKHLPQKLKVSETLAKKLKRIQGQENAIPQKYLVAGQPLGRGEIYKRPALYRQNIFNTSSTSPTKLNFQSGDFQCLGYNSSNNSHHETSILSIYSSNWQAIIVHANRYTNKLLEPIYDLPKISLCHYKSHKFKNTYISFEDDMHTNLLKNLLNLGISNIQKIEDLIYYINYPRFVLNAEKNFILMESLRADKTLANYLNTLNIPIYHKNNIGKIQSFYSFSDNKQSGVLMDPREPNVLKCSIHD
jgi:hypothetical protein